MRGIRLFYFFIFSMAVYACGGGNDIKKEFYSNGNLKSESEIHDGKLNGIKKVYYENGSVNWTANYINDQENGKYQKFNEAGQLILDVDYKNGKQDGLTMHYFSSGKIKSEIQFKNGLQNGTSKHYHPNGQLSLDAFVKNDTTLYFEEYEENGKLYKKFNSVKLNPLTQDSIVVGDLYKVNIVVASKSEDKISAIVNIVDIPSAAKNVAIENGVGYYEFALDKPGIYSLVLRVQIEGNDSTIYRERKIYVTPKSHG